MPAPHVWPICPVDVDIFHWISEDVQGIKIHHLETTNVKNKFHGICMEQLLNISFQTKTGEP